MDDYVKKEIARENRAETDRTSRMGAGDWSMVLGAALLVAAVLGFIYVSETEGVPASAIEPAAGVAPAPVPADDQTETDTLENEPAPGPSVTPSP